MRNHEWTRQKTMKIDDKMDQNQEDR